jgi:hypothetical protein
VLERIHDFLVGFLPDGAEYELTDYSRYRMHQRAASSMRVGRVLLAGFWSGGSRIESPSVVTGEYLSRGRNAIA